ncbi:MAG: aldo/keto reductase [Dehalococcoidales bacterium]|nr:aldo/keto reductase [Dehalococcoidales bacterium]
MKYRQFGKLDWKVSALGFGAMRLPSKGTDMSSPVDEPEAIRIMRYAIDHGVNYLDTAYMYHMGNSEKILGRVLKDGYRDKVKVATKLPVNMLQKADEADRIINEQLERLQIPKIDFYLFHGLNKAAWQKVCDWGLLRWAEKQMDAGKFSYLGFSFHDEFALFKEIVDACDKWTFCQVQYNYMDVNYQAGRKGVEYAASKNLAIVVMEPLRGGMISRNPPEKVAKIWQMASSQRSLADWGLQWVWNQPEISVALSGMSNMQQVVENVASAEQSGSGLLTAGELSLYDRVREAYKTLHPVPCTGCRYCSPCPNGVDIPGIFELYNEMTVYSAPQIARFRYQSPFGLKPEQRADNCIECGKCVEVCPQKINIPQELKKAHRELTGK